MYDNKTILVTGGTGSVGSKFVEYLLKENNPKKVIIYSRDEHKQYLLGKKFKDYSNVRYFIGNIRDSKRLNLALQDVDFVIHTAALKHVHVCEYNPFEAVMTNIYGAQNLIRESISNKVKKVIVLSTDKAVNSTSLYGGTKFVADKLFLAAKHYSTDTLFSIVRCGNIAGSRGSVIPYFRELFKKKNPCFPITDYEMTRFWMDIDDVIQIINTAIYYTTGSDIFVPKMSSFKIVDLAKAFNQKVKLKCVGIANGEKLHESIITKADRYVYDFDQYYRIVENPLKFIKRSIVEYNSKSNNDFLSISDLKERLG